MSYRKALFAGSFDPYTAGHHALLRKALTLFDEVVIAIGINDNKRTLYSVEQRLEMIRALYAFEPNIKVDSYNGLTIDYAKEYGIDVMVRGVRSMIDFEYERMVAEANRQLSGIETILFFTDPHLQHISSTIVRELIRFNRDVTPFLPEGLVLPPPTTNK